MNIVVTATVGAAPPYPSSDAQTSSQCYRLEVLREAEGGWVARKTVGPETRDGRLVPAPKETDGKAAWANRMGAESFLSPTAVRPGGLDSPASAVAALPEEAVGVGARWTLGDGRTDVVLRERSTEGAVLSFEQTWTGERQSTRTSGVWRLGAGAPLADEDYTIVRTERLDYLETKDLEVIVTHAYTIDARDVSAGEPGCMP